MFCSKCGAENPDDSSFCGNCDAAFSPPPMPPQMALAHAGNGGYAQPLRVQQYTSPSAAPITDGLKFGIIFGSLFIPLLAVVMGVIYMQDHDAKKKAVARLWLQVGIPITVLQCVLSSMFCASFQ